MNIFINGTLTTSDKPQIFINDRGFLLGDGIFETLKAINGNILHFEEHFIRLKNSANFFRIPFNYSIGRLLTTCKNLLDQNDLNNSIASIRITLTRGPGARGIDIPNESRPTLLITVAPYQSKHFAPRAYITNVCRNEFSETSKHKTLQFTDSILARALAKDNNFDEGIMLNTKGFITESSIANLFFVIDNKILTPKLEDGILPGIVRGSVIKICVELNIPLLETSIRPDDALNATEAFQTNSLIGIQPLSAINEKNYIYTENSLVKRIISLYDKQSIMCLA